MVDWQELYSEHAVDRSAARPVPPPKTPSRLQRVHRFVKDIEPWGIMFAVVGFFLSLIAFWIDYQDRVEERSVRAWQLVTTKAPGNSGKRAALEYLNRKAVLCLPIACKRQTPLAGIDLSAEDDQAGTYLRKVDLRGASLYGAKFIRAYFREANLSGANLGFADLGGANLWHADLSGANLEGANLRSAILLDANLSGAKFLNAHLNRANLRGANLRDAKNLTQRQLDQACGDEKTELGDGLTITLCTEVDWFGRVHGYS